MRIAITSDMYYPTLNGVSVFSRNLAIELSKRGHEVIVIAPSQTGEPHTEVDENYVIHRLKSRPFPFYRNQTEATVVEELTREGGDKRKWKKVLAQVREYLPKVYEKGFMVSISPAREMTRILDKFKPDVIHNQQELMIGSVISGYAKKRHIPVMTTNHIMPDNLFNNLKMPKLIEKGLIGAGNAMTRSFLERFDFVTMPTQLVIEGLYENVPPRIPITAVSNGINLKEFNPGKPDKKLMAKYKLSPSDKIVTFVGRLDREKHIPILMEAFTGLKADKNLRLLIVGDGDELKNLQKLTRTLEIADRTVFIGRVSREEIAAIHRFANVFVMPSPAEMQSIATLEAMASGKPIVVVDAGAVPELVDGNGFVVTTADPIDMARAIQKILGDKKLAQKFGKRSLEIAKTHELGRTIDRFEAIYHDLAKKPRPRGVAYVAIGTFGLTLAGAAMLVGDSVNKAKSIAKKTKHIASKMKKD